MNFRQKKCNNFGAFLTHRNNTFLYNKCSNFPAIELATAGVNGQPPHGGYRGYFNVKKAQF